MPRNTALSDPIDRAVSPEVFAEHSVVRLRASILSNDGRSLPGGAVGAVVGVWAEGTAYLIEFAEPFQAVVTVSAQDMARVESTET